MKHAPMIEKVARAIERAWSRNHASIESDPNIAWKVWTPEAEGCHSKVTEAEEMASKQKELNR